VGEVLDWQVSGARESFGDKTQIPSQGWRSLKTGKCKGTGGKSWFSKQAHSISGPGGKTRTGERKLGRSGLALRPLRVGGKFPGKRES